jgi:tRNA-dihydrouridine synthase C
VKEVEHDVGIKDKAAHGADYNARLSDRHRALSTMSRILLAPMEGMADDVLRGVLTAIGGYDWGICEFIRVSDTLLPNRTFTRVCPELLNGSRTHAGTPIRVQLLGSDPQRLAENAARLVALSPAGVDLNFGCPAPTVNRHRGGAALLDEPELLNAITTAVRAVVPPSIPFTAKMRLGINDTGRATECAQALAAGGIDELIVHGRTKLDRYQPPARWACIDEVRQAVALPIIANGEVWTVADFRRCQAETGCADIMIGRGAVADPLLARRVRGEAVGEWAEILPYVGEYWRGVRAKVVCAHAPGRLKQWLMLLRRTYPEAEILFQQLRPMKQARDINAALGQLGIFTPLPIAA